MAMMALASTRRPIALVYGDETYIQRNRTRQKLAARGFDIRKEYTSATVLRRAPDLTTVSMAIVIVEGMAAGAIERVRRAGREAGVPVIVLPHTQSKGWEVLDEHAAVGGALSLPASADAPATIASTDAEAAELYALLEGERDAAKAEVQRLTGELGNLRADRDRLTKERDAAVGRANRLQVEAEQARLGESESRERIRVLESELAAARQQNERLIKERDAAREALARRPDEDEYESLCEELAEERKERQRLAEALEAERARVAELQAALAESSRVDREDFEVIATSLRTLVAAKVMSAEEAFEKLVEAVK